MNKDLQEKHGRLTIVSDPFYKGIGKRKQYYVSTICECGVSKDIRVSHIKSGLIRSCGCFRNQQNLIRSITHGLTRHPLYGVWLNMRNRCYRPNNERYSDYGGRGVQVCEAWKNDFKSFYDWAISNGWQKGLNLDKDIIPEKLGIPAVLYSPDVCCFVTVQENNRNKKNTLRANKVAEIRSLHSAGRATISELSQMYGVARSTISAIINKTNWV